MNNQITANNIADITSAAIGFCKAVIVYSAQMKSELSIGWKFSFTSAHPVLVVCMLKIFDLVLDGKGVGWMFFRFALIGAPAVIAIILLSIFFRLD